MIEPEHNSEEVTRILFQNFPEWMVISFYIVAFAAIAVFLYGCYVQIRKYRRGASVNLKAIGSGIAEMIKALLSHRPIKRRDKAAGHTHAMIFFGFALLFIGTSIIRLLPDHYSAGISGMVASISGSHWYWILPASH